MKMLIIQQSKLTSRTLLLTLLFEFTLVDKNTSNETICTGRRNISYFKDDTVMGVNWTEAWEQCRKRNATLPVICNQNEQNDFAIYLKEQNIGSSVVWTSGRKIPLSAWTWVDGQTYRGRPTIPSRHEAYTHITLTQERHYEAADPRNKMYYLCQYSDGDSSCSSPNATRVTNGCIVLGDTDRTWYDARNQCLAKGGDLAILSDAELVTLRESKNLNQVYSYWIGLRKDAWYWTSQDSESLRAATANEVKYSNWSTYEPSLSSACVSIDARNGGWASVRCTDSKRVVCETSSAETTLSIPAISSKTSSPTSRGPTMSSTTLSNVTGLIPDMSENAINSCTNIDCSVLLIVVVVVSLCLIVISNIIVALVVRKCIYRKVNASLNSASAGNKQYQDLETTRRQLNPDGTYDELQLQLVYEEVSQRRK